MKILGLESEALLLHCFLKLQAAAVILPLLVFTVVAVKFMAVNLWAKPRRMEARFAAQGIRGPPYRFFIGNLHELLSMMIKASSHPIPQSSHNILHKVLPFYHHWNKLYGSAFLVWFGTTARLAVSNPELIREIFTRTEVFEKYEAHPVVKQLEGKNGLLNIKGDVWAHHRKILAPTFHMHNLKMLVPAIAKSVSAMLDEWPATSAVTTSGEFEIEVSEWFETLTEDAVTRAAFGCSYEVGKPIFRLQSEQMVLAADSFHKVFIPGYRFLPTRRNIKSWKLEREVTRLLRRLIESRVNSVVPCEEFDNGHQDLIGLMIEASKSNSSINLTVDDMIDECKAFFFAGKQTISKLLTWTSLLLAMHPEWQDRAREELRSVCGSSRDLPSKDDIFKLKTLSMIINESLRLYPPTVATIRRTKADVELGGYMIPKGMEFLISVLAVHHDRAIWGEDANEFSPARFEDGVARAAKHPTAFIPFGLGVRRCIGQNLAVLLAKLAMAVILQRYSFNLSPNYRHAPKVLLMLYPQFGAPIVFRPL